MKLYIDTTDREKIVLEIDGKKFETGNNKNNSQELLIFIEEVLKKNKIVLEDIKEIEVNTGPGSYTGIRIGVSIANALGYALNIPINKKKLELDIKY